MELLQNSAFLALIGTLFGASLLKITETLLGKRKVETDLAAELRKELRDEVAGLRTELKTVEHDLDLWRDRYYKLVNDLFESRSDFAELNRVMREALMMQHAKSLQEET